MRFCNSRPFAKRTRIALPPRRPACCAHCVCVLESHNNKKKLYIFKKRRRNDIIKLSNRR